MKILFVCTGNVCRSPMAQVIFENLAKKNKRKDIIVKSAGLMTLNGLPMTDTAREALIKCGEKLGKRVRKTTRWSDDMVNEYDYIITVTEKHAQYIGDYENVYALDDLTGSGPIHDPFMQPIEVYVSVCKQLQIALDMLYDKIT